MEDQFGDEPAYSTDDEEDGLEVVGSVVEELGLLPPGDLGGSEHSPEVSLHIEGMASRPAHPLFHQFLEAGDALGGGLDEGGVEDLVAIKV